MERSWKLRNTSPGALNQRPNPIPGLSQEFNAYRIPIKECLSRSYSSNLQEAKNPHARKPIPKIYHPQSVGNTRVHQQHSSAQHDYQFRRQMPQSQLQMYECAPLNRPKIQLRPKQTTSKILNSNEPSGVTPLAEKKHCKYPMKVSQCNKNNSKKVSVSAWQQNQSVSQRSTEANEVEDGRKSAFTKYCYNDYRSSTTTSEYRPSNTNDTNLSTNLTPKSRSGNTTYDTCIRLEKWKYPANISVQKKIYLFEAVAPHSLYSMDELMTLYRKIYQCYTPDNLYVEKEKCLKLSLEIWRRHMHYEPEMKTFCLKMRIWKHLQMLLEKQTLKSHCKLFMIGSTMSGLSICGSDVDLSLIADNRPEFTAQHNDLFHLQCFKHLVVKLVDVANVTMIQDNTPVLRFTVLIDYPITVNVKCNNLVAVANTQLLYSYTRCDWRLQPIYSIVKQWAIHNNINVPQKKTLSSYSISLLIIQFLQGGVSPPVLPCLHQYIKDLHWEDIDGKNPKEIFECWLVDWESENKMSLGELLLGFFRFYCEIDFKKYIISVRLGSPVLRESYEDIASFNEEDFMIVEEPFTLKNTSYAVNCSVEFEMIIKSITAASKVLEDTLELENLFK